MSEDDRQEGESSESAEAAEELEFAEAAGDDELSAEEQALFASYVFPEPSHRRISAVAFWTFGAALIVAWIALRSDPVVSVGALVGGITLVGAGVWFWSAGWHLRLDQGEALITATREAGFPVGHASALLGWRGVTARPTWRILLYSAETPPSRRGLVEIDATTGEVLGSYTGDNVEDW
ncbi:MAG: hypothetical protein K1X95_11840 [Acidimicrobiia bacterium]|nr:hypothetical protein [Acidimicrobiia bacterium]